MRRWSKGPIGEAAGCRGGLTLVLTGKQLRLDIGSSLVKGIDQCEERYVSGGPAVHGSKADMALGVASLPEGQAGRRHFVLGPAIGTFKDHHPFTPSDGDSVLSEEHFGLHGAAIRAFKFVN
jgi:hypothetical protein